MRKYFFFLLLLICGLGPAIAQNQYWEHPGINFNYAVEVMYYDSVTEKSYIGGSFTQIDGSPCKLLVYDGQSYTPFPVPPPAGVGNLRSIVRYHDKLYVCGYGATLASWDGNAWDIIDTGSYFNLRVWNDKLYAMGFYDTASAVLQYGGIGVWNDTVWTGLLGIDSIVSSGGNAIDDIAFYKGRVYVGGNWHNAAKPWLSDFMMHDGQGWQQVGNWGGSGMGNVNRLLVWRDTLYVAGSFTESPVVPGNGIVAWDGQQWHRLQRGVRGLSEAGTAVFDLNIYQDELWVAGFFSIINGRYVNDNYGKVAKWNGGQWCTMDTWLLGGAYGIGRWKDELFLLGGFNLPEDFSKRILLKWTGGSYSDTCNQDFTVGVDDLGKEHRLKIECYPNPHKEKFILSFVNNGSLASGKKLTIELIDVRGSVSSRLQHQLVYGKNETLINTRHLKPGIYSIRLLADGVIVGTVKVVKQ
ncbi:MAG: T9SS type A sorting domain-containing protein [Taibaiella sp.]|nr:T9SS type A sorting domain-containing protein [Taibaiella sp.]